MDEPGSEVEIAERLVREGEALISRQLALVRKLDAENRHSEAHQARELLGTMTETLNAARRDLQIRRYTAG